MLVGATDLGTPDPNTAATLARVQVTVIRNTAPRFLNKENYNTAIPMTRLAGDIVFRTNFTDADTVVGLTLTRLSVVSFLWDIYKQSSHRCDAAKCGVTSEAILFA